MALLHEDADTDDPGAGAAPVRTRVAMLLIVVGAPLAMLAWIAGIAWSLTLIF